MKEPENRRRRPYRLWREPADARLPGKTRRRGLFVSITAVAAATLIVVGSLYNIQIENGEMFTRYASDQQLLDTTIEAKRGEIYDATGKVLASTSVVWDIWCDPSYSTALYTTQTLAGTDPQAGEGAGTSVRTLNAAACAEVSHDLTVRLLSGDGVSLDAVDTGSAAYAQKYEEIYAALSSIDSSYQVLAEKVNNAVKESIEAYLDARSKDKTKTGRVSVSASRTYQRNYPYGAFAAAVLGFTNADGEGFYGLERSYDDVLSGTDGRTVTIRNARGNAIADSSAVTYDAKDGNSLVLTLDTTVQEVAERYLNEAIAANRVENRGCAIVMDVKTGGILAMASKPDFDPNNPTDYSANLAYWEELVRAEPELYGIYLKNEDGAFVTDEEGNKILDPEADYSGYFRDIMWKNKTITELYYPGSVFKVITAAMGLDAGQATLNTTFDCRGAYAVAKETYHCAGRHSHGVQNLADALRNSCNIYFIQLGQRVGVQTFYDYFKAFGFTERTGVDLPNETAYMQYYTDQNMGEVELASSAFGQSMAVTPLQVCTAVAAAVNGGYLVTPHVVDRIVDANGNVVEQIGPEVRRQVISESASAAIRQIMEYEVGDGSTTRGGYRAYVAGYRIGGKSGTSELLNMDRRADGDYKKAASFVAVLPADDPQILVYVMLDDPNNAGTDYSSVLAAPVVGNIISEVAPYLGIATDGIDRSGQTVKVPNLIGTEWSNAQVSLNILGLAHNLVESAGGNVAAPVTWQYPTAGTEVPSGTTVYLYTDGTAGSTTTVPDLTGKSADFARQMLAAAGLNCVVEGEGPVQSQSAAPGDTVQRGTIVTVTCGQPL